MDLVGLMAGGISPLGPRTPRWFPQNLNARMTADCRVMFAGEEIPVPDFDMRCS